MRIMYRPLTPFDFPNFLNSKNKKAPLRAGRRVFKKQRVFYFSSTFLPSMM